MRGMILAALGVASMAIGSSANAITIDGAYDSEYGAAKSTVTYSATAPDSNFAAPTKFSNAIGYTVYLTNSGGIIYGLLQTGGAGQSAGAFANLYFANAAGSAIGFEITNQRAFNLGGPSGVYGATPIDFKVTATSIEFALPETYFTSQIPGLAMSGFMPGDSFVLALSQSFGYSVAGGTSYGDTRLGLLTLSGGAAVPGPLAGAGLVPLLGAAVVAMARRRRRAA